MTDLEALLLLMCREAGGGTKFCASLRISFEFSRAKGSFLWGSGSYEASQLENWLKGSISTSFLWYTEYDFWRFKNLLATWKDSRLLDRFCGNRPCIASTEQTFSFGGFSEC